MVGYIFSNRDTQKIYCVVEAETVEAAKEEWAKRCGCEDFNELYRKSNLCLNELVISQTIADGRGTSTIKQLVCIYTSGINYYFIFKSLKAVVVNVRKPHSACIIDLGLMDLQIGSMVPLSDIPPEILEVASPLFEEALN